MAEISVFNSYDGWPVLTLKAIARSGDFRRAFELLFGYLLFH